MNLEIPACTLENIVMTPVDERVRGVNVKQSSALEGWLQVGEPLFRELNTDTLGDSPLAAFVRESAAYRFVLVFFACSFRPAEGEPFEEAWFNVKLSSDIDSAIAWSMTPERLTDDYKLTNSVTFGAELKLEPVTVKAERSTDQETTVGQVYIEALNLLAPNPVWELRRTKARDLRGLHQLQLVVRLPRKARVSAELSLEASVRRKALGLIPYAAAFQGGSARVVSLP